MSGGRDEIELKFLCEAADIPALLAAAPGKDAPDAALNAAYFDTPDRRLRAREASLRLRDEPDGRRQTLKAGRGLKRLEDEIVPEGEGLDLSHPALVDLIGEAAAELAAAFEVRVSRRARRVAVEGGEIELAFDQGEVAAGGRVRRLCELELELKSGPPSALFALARRLSAVAPLYLSFESKADQGFALADGLEARRPPARLKPGMTAAEAFQALARRALADLAACGLALRASDAAEAVHQLRVAARRLRSAFSAFKPLLSGEAFARLKAEAEWIAAACDEARELDVFIGETYRPAAQGHAAILGLADLGAALEAARDRAHARAQAAVASARFRGLLLDLCAWIEDGDWLAALEDGGGPIEAYARKALAQRRKKLARAGGRDLAALADAERHRVRLHAKKLRYAVEDLRPLLAEKPARRLVKRLKALQDALGGLNDAAGAEALLTGLRLDGPGLYAAGHLAGEVAARREARMAAALSAWRALQDAEDAW